MSDTNRATEEKSKRGLKEWFKSSQVLLSMILVQVFVTGLQLLSRVVLVQGSFIFSLIAYRFIVATICVAPFALYFERYVFHSSYLFLIKFVSLLIIQSFKKWFACSRNLILMRQLCLFKVSFNVKDCNEITII